MKSCRMCCPICPSKLWITNFFLRYEGGVRRTTCSRWLWLSCFLCRPSTDYRSLIDRERQIILVAECFHADVFYVVIKQLLLFTGGRTRGSAALIPYPVTGQYSEPVQSTSHPHSQFNYYPPISFLVVNRIAVNKLIVCYFISISLNDAFEVLRSCNLEWEITLNGAFLWIDSRFGVLFIFLGCFT
jgi:hypothetical protein